MSTGTVPYNPDDFCNLRHIGPSRGELAEMLDEMGYRSEEDLIDALLPPQLGRTSVDGLGKPLTEQETLELLRETASRNQEMISLIGMGYYRTVTPLVILRNILENPAWYTAYTPYQAEISQGRLEVLAAFQTMICDLTGLEVANASLLDEATAAAEAMAMARRVSRSRSDVYFVDRNCHPQTISVIRTRARPTGIRIVVGDPLEDLAASDCFGAVFQYPGTDGEVRDFSDAIEQLHGSGGIAVVAADLMALAVLKDPGAMGADIAVGTTQRFGVPMGYGGPHAGYIAARDARKRELPGRIVGLSVDSGGRNAYRLALQTREQHIRRQKAKSNICTAQVLPAVLASMYAVFHGAAGIRAIANRIHGRAATLARALTAAGHVVETGVFFDTIVVRVGQGQQQIINAARESGINFRIIGQDRIGISLDEMVDEKELAAIANCLDASGSLDHGAASTVIPKSLRRTSTYLEHPAFNANRSELSITRYMRRLSDKDLALDRTMIPLGSCTMKLNATVEMIPVTFPEFGNIHPFAPAEQVAGYRDMIDDLCDRLCRITGYDAISMQPNSGAQGEFAGLMAIRAYHEHNGDDTRVHCLIPKSAHGTNAASAQLAGMEVIEIRSRDDGTVDLDDLTEKAEQVGDTLAATMITYPSTHGVFEDTIRDVVDITHRNGGQVYFDGANLNSLVGIARPGDLGADVGHLNLHKTFCIPHGGGGPGMGPIGVKSHLVPFLPGDPLLGTQTGAVSATMFGSASILPVSWAYILMMGAEGLARATRIAIVNANYIATRIRKRFEICYSGNRDLVAHECIIDIRKAVEGTNITIDDVAKRLIDCGFHPPTMSWPVAGTLMVEPTESESKEELDRFCDAMLGIMDEIDDVRNGKLDADNNPLVNSPHSLAEFIEGWDRPYPASRAAFPPGCDPDNKYWPPTNRIDNVWGDRHFVGVLPDNR